MIQFFTKEQREHIVYTWKHKIAFLKVQKILLGYNTFSGYLHDVDKLFLYVFLDCQTVNKIHRAFMSHHLESYDEYEVPCMDDILDMIVDWECARFTKPDKPLNAAGTLEKFYPKWSYLIKPVLKFLDIESTDPDNYVAKKYNELNK